MTSLPSCYSHRIMICDIQMLSSPPSVLLLRTCEVGCPLYNRAEGGHKDRQQREALWIGSNEGTALQIHLIYLSSCLSSCAVHCGCHYGGCQAQIMLSLHSAEIAAENESLFLSRKARQCVGTWSCRVCVGTASVYRTIGMISFC